MSWAAGVRTGLWSRKFWFLGLRFFDFLGLPLLDVRRGCYTGLVVVVFGLMGRCGRVWSYWLWQKILKEKLTSSGMTNETAHERLNAEKPL